MLFSSNIEEVLSINPTMAFGPLGNSDHVFVSVSINFPSNSKRDVPFYRIAYDYYRADWDGVRDHLRDVPWEGIFKLGSSADASEFCEWFISIVFSCLCCCHSSWKSLFSFVPTE